MWSRLEAVRAVPMFRDLPPAVLQTLVGRMTEQTYLRGDPVFLEGDAPRGLFLIWRGSLKVFKVGDGGREQILEIEGPGNSVAELPLFDGQPYPASCAALEDSVVLTLPTDAFHDLVDREPAVARAVIAGLSTRLRRMVGLVEELSLKAVRQRLADLLIELAGDTATVQLPWSNHEIAARIGTVREIVSRTFSRMAQDGAIAVEGRTVRLVDRARLGGP